MRQAVRQDGHQLLIDAWASPRLGSVNRARPVIGDFWEEATAQMLGAKRLHINSNAASCPDLILGGVPIEVKSSGRSGRFFLYEETLERTDPHTIFVIWCHRLVFEPTTVDGLRRSLAAALTRVIILPLTRLRTFLTAPAKRVPHRGPRGAGSFGKVNGWPLYTSAICDGWAPRSYFRPLFVYGVHIPGFVLHE